MSQRIPTHIARYEVIERYNHGGMSDVYLAKDVKLGGRRVAIKVPRVADDNLRARLLQEAAIAGNLIHPNIVTIYDSGEHEGQPFIVMEFVEGMNLAGLIKANTPMRLGRKLELMTELTDGLGFAHTFRAEGIAGIVHRDVKPDNLIIDRNDVLRILDFGIARMTDSRMTLDRSAIGTPSYMSPEQVDGGAIDHRSDIFSAGVVFYELLSYQQAFPGHNFHMVMTAVVNDMPRPLHELVPDLDPALEAIVLRAIQKDPAKRFQSMSEFGAEVRRVAAGLDVDMAGTHRVTMSEGLIVNPRQTPRPTPAGQTPRSGTRNEEQRAALSKRRQEAIEGHLRTAEQALEAGDYAAAVAAGEAAAVIDPDAPRVLDLLERVRNGQDAVRAAEHVHEARALFEQHQFAQALEQVGQALELVPESADAEHLKAEIERARASQEAAQLAMTRAQQLLADGRFEAAIRAASEVLVHDPVHQAAHELSQRALRSLDEQRQRESQQRAARAAVDEQRRAFASGRCREAVAALERFTPQNELVTAALRELRGELAGLEAWASAEIARARQAVAQRRFAEAMALLEPVNQRLPGTDGVSDLMQAARDGEAAEQVRLRKALAEKVHAATDALARGQVEEATTLADAARELAPRDPAVVALDAAIQLAVTNRRRQAEADRVATALVAEARLVFSAGEPAPALAMLERFTPASPIVTAALKELRAEALALENAARTQAEDRRRADAIRDALNRARQLFSGAQFVHAGHAADEVLRIDPHHKEAQELARDAARALEEERQRERHEQRVTSVVEEQTRAFEAGRRREAIAVLEGFTPPHDRVRAALDDLRHQLDALEDWAAGQVIAARRAIAAGRFTEAAESLRHVADVLPGTPDVDPLLEAAAAGQAGQLRRHQQALAERLEAGRAALEAGRLDQAVVLVGAALKLEPTSPEALALDRELSAAMERWRQEERDRTASTSASAADSADADKTVVMFSQAPPATPAPTPAPASGSTPPASVSSTKTSVSSSKKGQGKKAKSSPSVAPPPSPVVQPTPPATEVAAKTTVPVTEQKPAPPVPAPKPAPVVAAPDPKRDARPAPAPAPVPAPVKVPPPQPGPSTSMPVAYIAAAIGVVVVLGAGAWFMLSGNKPTTTAGIPAGSPQSPPPVNRPEAKPEPPVETPPRGAQTSPQAPPTPPREARTPSPVAQTPPPVGQTPPPVPTRSQPGQGGPGRNAGPAGPTPAPTPERPTSGPSVPPQRGTVTTPAPSTQTPSPSPGPSAPTPTPVNTVQIPVPGPTGQGSAPGQPVPVQTAPTPSPEPARPQPGLSDEAAVRAVLQAYASAWSNKDIPGVQRLQPTTNPALLKRSFDGMKSQSVQLQNMVVTANGNSAQVSCVWDITFDAVVGGRQHQTRPTTFNLQKTGTQWVIIERR